MYTVAYAVKSAFRTRTGDDFVVGPLEGLWSADDHTVFSARAKHAWHWTMLIALPDDVSDDDVAAGLATASRTKPHLPVAQVYRLTLPEGRCLQIMHVGSYDAETPTLERLHREVMPAGGWRFNGRHHEIYLSDPRRVAPDKSRTILRQPVEQH